MNYNVKSEFKELFSTICVGQFFDFDGHYYLKISNDPVSNAFCLASDKKVSFSMSDPVVPLKHTLNLERI